MLDNPLITLVISTLKTALAAINQSAILVQQGNQPTQQGANTAPTLYLYKIGDEMIGTRGVSDVWQQVQSASFTGSISGTALTVSAVTGTINPGDILNGAGIPALTTIVSGSGTSWVINRSLTVGSESMTTGTEEMVHTETQQMATSFQLNALATQNPSNQSQLTAADILNFGRYALQAQPSIALFEAQGVGILGIKMVPNPNFMDDSDLHEYNPHLDFTMTHKQILTTETPILQSEEVRILSV